ncbi:hypothetical protein Q765_15120 [Flavobacterium rivuli WB 3.3-2 = DSM 21788]|uniref:Uncharacterized protein n=2 Tax=Flavobacterium rivuli TaxID=498301 RepID=A0A0A2M0H1_9FLAO|nr:hypothetical protein Q765_15120 [Flavobacterium rivuli WB 3.3-2 = DSM 21788]
MIKAQLIVLFLLVSFSARSQQSCLEKSSIAGNFYKEDNYIYSGIVLGELKLYLEIDEVAGNQNYISIKISDENRIPLAGATCSLVTQTSSKNSTYKVRKLLAVTNSEGRVQLLKKDIQNLLLSIHYPSFSTKILDCKLLLNCLEQ